MARKNLNDFSYWIEENCQKLKRKIIKIQKITKDFYNKKSFQKIFLQKFCLK